MFENIASQVNPQTLKKIKIAAVVVCVATGAIVAGVVAYKLGVFGQTTDVVEDVIETAVSAA